MEYFRININETKTKSNEEKENNFTTIYYNSCVHRSDDMMKQNKK